MKITTGLDWVTYSAPTGTNFATILPEHFEMGSNLAPLPYYTTAAELQPSGRIDWNVRDPKQGIRVTFNGGDLRSMEANGIKPDEMLSAVAGKTTCKLTRVDIAIDLMDSGGSPDDVFSAWGRGEKESRARKCRQVHGYCDEQERDGNTVYIGSRTGEMYVRVYDKALETIGKNHVEEKQLVANLRALDYKRVEAEMKGQKAVLAGKSVMMRGIAPTVTEALNRYVKFPTVSWWNEMIKLLPDITETMLQGTNHNKGGSNKWLMTQALPAVLKAVRAGNWQVIEALEAALNDFDFDCSEPLDSE